MLALALSIALIPKQDAPRQRTICRNGAAIVVERMADEPMISVQLWASSRSVPESAKTHGWRHLLEHLVARGSGDLDRRLEKSGGYLRARTFRDAMQFEISVGPKNLDLAISALSEIMRPLRATQEDIDREIAIFTQEFATYDDAAKLSAGAWFAAYGEGGLDPFGKEDTIKLATPESLRDLQRKHFYPENLVVAIAGDVDIKKATEAATVLVGMKQGATRAADSSRPLGSPGRIEIDGFGEGRAALVSAYDRPQTVGSLAFALAIGSTIEGGFVTYTPSIQRGVMMLGQTEKQSGIGLRIDAVAAQEWPQLFAVGKILARQWVNRYMTSASGVAYIRGLLMVQGLASRPEAMLTAIHALTLSEFKEAALAFSKDRAVTVVGS